MKPFPNLRIAASELDPNPDGPPRPTRRSPVFDEFADEAAERYAACHDRVDWHRIVAGLMASVEHVGWAVVRAPLLRSTGYYLVSSDGVPVLAVDSRLDEDRDVAEVLAHEVGHAVHGPRWLCDEEPAVDVRKDAWEWAADLIGLVLIGSLAADLDKVVLPLADDTRSSLLDMARRQPPRRGKAS